MLGFCSSPEFVNHVTGPRHPERPERIAAIFQAVRAAGIITSPNSLPTIQLDLGSFPPAGLPVSEISPKLASMNDLLAIHSQSYIDRICHISSVGGSIDAQGDTPVGPGSFEVALLAVGAALACCDAVVVGEADRAFAAVRPPGHHAEPNQPMGFCLFSNVAIAARYLQRIQGVGKIAIVDFDVHHGNGTQAAFESDPSVLFISLHQHPRTCYPGSGFDWENGVGPGSGFTLNIPMPLGSDDADYLKAVSEQVVPKLDGFKPEFLLLSAGFDAHRDDPLASINLSEDGFGLITRALVDVANMHCDGKIVSLLEGGYDLRALGRSVVRHLIELNGIDRNP